MADEKPGSLSHDPDLVETDIHTREASNNPRPPQSVQRRVYTALCIFLLLINYFLAQYDKFVLSYFQTPLSDSIGLSATQYGVLSGYATGIVYALAAIPIAYLADTFGRARVWVLAIAALWWSLCVIFQSLSNNFWQILLARIGMGIGQSCVEPLSVSLISDLAGGWKDVFIGEAVLYVGVYIGEAISGQIATAFTDNEAGWRIALRAIGITGVVVAVVLRVLIRDVGRNAGLVVDDSIYKVEVSTSHFQSARRQVRLTLSYLLRLRSFWLLLLSASIRQLAGNVFGFYMPSYLSNTYPDKDNLLSRYGIIVGVVGSVAVLTGGILTSLLWKRTQSTPLWLTGIGGMVSSLFVLLMLFSRDIANGSQNQGIRILYGTMSVAYLSAELWLGCINALIALLLPPRHKTFGLAIWAAVQVLVYSSGPEIIGLALKGTDPGSEQYTEDSQVVLAVIITVCYWLAGIGFITAVPLLKFDIANGVRLDRAMSQRRKIGFTTAAIALTALVIALFVASIVYAAI
ncbi:hypothetical protein B0A50_00923 [Salinomyces thailandicus]|uniref:Major facilitator superfamily (MFS) profile domain-containing protein n=1 Tax=Salinomyces thailandicus TaxID=706561 RepID=A0A4U0UD01_9PEZI|nr:hypothetical protein B0A50_00923 [Salinomyces thailandica]